MIGITMGIFIIVLFLFIRPLIIDDAKLMDQEALLINQNRVESYVKAEMDDLQRINRDWAIWDDTYQFVQDRNPEYIDSNLVVDTFANTGTNFFVYIDDNDRIVHSEGYDLTDGSSLNLTNEFPPAAEMIAKAQMQEGITVLKSEEFGHYLISVESIMTSENEGPEAGHLIMGKFLDPSFFETMEKSLAIEMEVVEAPEGNKAEISEEETGVLVATVWFGDELGVKVKRQQIYYKEKLKSMNDLFLALSLATLLLVFLVYYLLDLLILSRVSFLSTQMTEINFDKRTSLEIKKSRNAKDEISDLENSIQKMLQSLETAHSKVSSLAFYDQLTALPNRFNLYKEFEARLNKKDSAFSVLFFDLDGFKQVNDLHGHNSGDELLKQLGERLTVLTEKNGSCLFRIGGDEFILLSDTVERSQLIEQVEEIMEGLQQDFVLEKATVSISSSIGISVYPTDATTLDDLLQYADSAMYEAKNNGKNHYVFYEDLSNKNHYKYMVNFKNDLMYAAAKNQLFIEYQPIMDNLGRHMVGVEALVRWNHPEQGVIPPLQFIPLAEEIGAIKEIGAWVMRNAVKDIRQWNQSHNQSLIVAVNVSKLQLKNQEELLGLIDDILRENDFPPHLLQLEITESDTATEHQEISALTHELKMRNLLVAMDDFGVGTSSLFHLIKMDVDVVKIDRSFLRKVPASEKDTILLTGMYRTFTELNLQVVTEGIETAEQLEFLAGYSTQLQGYYFSKPVPLSQLEEFQELWQAPV